MLSSLLVLICDVMSLNHVRRSNTWRKNIITDFSNGIFFFSRLNFSRHFYATFLFCIKNIFILEIIHFDHYISMFMLKLKVLIHDPKFKSCYLQERKRFYSLKFYFHLAQIWLDVSQNNSSIFS